MAENLSPGWYLNESGNSTYWTGTEWIVPAVPTPDKQAGPFPSYDPASGEHTNAVSNGKLEDTLSEGASQERTYQVNEDSNHNPVEAFVPSSGITPTGAALRATRRSRVKGALLVLSALLLAGVVGFGIWYTAEQIESKKYEANQAAEKDALEFSTPRILVEPEVEETEKTSKEIMDEVRKELAEATAKSAAEQSSRDKSKDTFMASGAVGAKWDAIESGSLYYRDLEDSEFTCGRYNCFGIAVYSVKGCPGGVYVEASLLKDDVVVGMTNERLGALLPDETGSAVLDIRYDDVYEYRIAKVNCNSW